MKSKTNKNLKFLAGGALALVFFFGLLFISPVHAATPGVSGSPCVTDADCGAGLQCSTNSSPVCVVAGSPPVLSPTPVTIPGVPNSTPGTGIPGWCNNDPNLVYTNGVCLPKSDAIGNCSAGLCSSNSLTDLLLKVIKLLLGFAGVLAVVFLIIGGYWYITSAGSEEQAEKGRKALINAIIGLVVIILAYTIISVIASTISSPPGG